MVSVTAKELLIQEEEIKMLWEGGEIPWLTHLQGGNEEWICKYFEDHVDISKDWIFASHRCHFAYTLAGNTDLVEKVLKGSSMFLYSERFVCSAIVGGTLAMAAGMALSIQLRVGKEKVHCFLGDGATDQGSFWEALRFSECRDLPITYIVEDNGGQCGVDIPTRWGAGDPRAELLDHMMFQFSKVRHYQYTPTHPHAGTNDSEGKPTRPQLKLNGR